MGQILWVSLQQEEVSLYLNKPVLTLKEAVQKIAGYIHYFVPPKFAADAIMEAAEAGIKIIICITEGHSVQDGDCQSSH